MLETGLAGKIALVSGASKGIGLAGARSLAAEGVHRSLRARSGPALREIADERGPGTPDEIAPLGVFLLSDLSAYSTGTTIPVDGGLIRTI